MKHVIKRAIKQAQHKTPEKTTILLLVAKTNVIVHQILLFAVVPFLLSFYLNYLNLYKTLQRKNKVFSGFGIRRIPKHLNTSFTCFTNMANIQVTIKNVDADAFSELKAEAVRKKLPVGKALSLAIENWLAESRKLRLPLAGWKTTKGGQNTRLLSEQVDPILYG